jgi:tetratricopeptide (TPR) repeat protein
MSWMNNLGMAYTNAGHWNRAVPLLEAALKFFRARSGPDHQSTLSVAHNLARAYHGAGRLELALPLYEDTFRRRKAVLGSDHSDTLNSMDGLGGGYHAAGKLDQALSLYEETFQRQTTQLGPDHPGTLTMMNNLASVYVAAGKLDQALAIYTKAATGVEKLRFVHEHAGYIVTNLANCHEKLNQFDQAEAWQRKLLAALRERGETDSVAFAKQLSDFGSNLMRQKKWVDAEAALRESLTIRRAKAPEAWSTFNIQCGVGRALLEQKKYAEAEPLLVQGYSEMKAREALIPAENRKSLTAVAERLVQLYDEWGKPDDADLWRRELPAKK